MAHYGRGFLVHCSLRSDTWPSENAARRNARSGAACLTSNHNLENKEAVAKDSPILSADVGNESIKLGGNTTVKLTDILSGDKKELNDLIEQANFSQRQNWRRVLLTAPVVLTLLAGCARGNDVTRALAPTISTATPIVEMTRVPTNTVTQTSTRFPSSTPPPSSTLFPTPTREQPTNNVTATEKVKPTQEYTKQIDIVVREINYFLDFNGKYSTENLRKDLFSYIFKENTNQLGRLNDSGNEEGVMYPVNFQVILLGVVYEPHDVVLFFGTEDTQGKSFVFPAKLTRDYDTMVNSVVKHRLSKAYSPAGVDVDEYAFNSDVNITRFVSDNLRKPIIVMLLHREIPENTINEFVQNAKKMGIDPNLIIEGCKFWSQNTDVVRAIANRARKVLSQSSEMSFSSPAKDINKILFIGTITSKDLILDLEKIPPVYEIIAKK